MNLSEIDWNLNAAGNWPRPLKIVAGIILFSLIVGGWHYQFTSEKQTELASKETEVAQALDVYTLKYRKALNLEAYQQQYKAIEQSLAYMLRLMPTESEMAKLLVDISQTGLASGLEFTLFKPSGKVVREDVVELPIDIKVQGEYLELGGFISGLAVLPRVVTIKDIKINPIKDSKILNMQAIIATYQEIESEKSDADDLLNNQALVCLSDEGLEVKGCTQRSRIDLSAYPELVQRMKDKRKNLVPRPLKPLKEMPPIEIYTFNAEGARDPFSTVVKKTNKANGEGLEAGVRPDKNRLREVLEEYSLDTLAMVGRLKTEKINVQWGLLKVSDGKIYRVSEGNHVGKNYGKILRILQDKIEIMEIIPNGQGGWEEREASIVLSNEE